MTSLSVICGLLIFFPFSLEAPADTSAKENHLQCEFQSPIGIIPHQVSSIYKCFFHICLVGKGQCLFGWRLHNVVISPMLITWSRSRRETDANNTFCLNTMVTLVLVFLTFLSIIASKMLTGFYFNFVCVASQLWNSHSLVLSTFNNKDVVSVLDLL